MTDTPIPRTSPEGGNPASDLKSDVVEDVQREHTITGDFVAADDDGTAGTSADEQQGDAS